MDVLWLDCVQISISINWIYWCSASVIKNKFDINNLEKEIYVYVVWEIEQCSEIFDLVSLNTSVPFNMIIMFDTSKCCTR